MPGTAIQIIAIESIPEVQIGDDVAKLILRAMASQQLVLVAGDLLVVTHKIISKSENQLVDLATIQPSLLATNFAEQWGKDPRLVELVFRQSVRIVRMDRGIVISETTHGFVCANAGVDLSNIPGNNACLLPVDPDASAHRIAETVSTAAGFLVPVVVTDSWGRPWRNGIVNVAIGVAGLLPLTDYRGQRDPGGLELQASILATADEIAAAAELAMGKLNRCPVALLRGYTWQAGNGQGRDIVMSAERDMFR
ncbi:MAG: coenzyme F420-0:L-glutamate ligase [Herpetosiphon sp.]